MGNFPASGHWSIYSVQKTLPYLGRIGAIFGAHNYLALVRPDGVVDSEMQGVYSGKNFVMNGPVPGKYLNVRVYDPDEYIPDQSILSAKPVFFGTEEDIRNLLHTGYRAVAEALDTTHMLYDGAEIFGHAVNSNSVWYTALLAMGVKDPSQFDGWGSTPGNRIDLRKEPTNNEWFATSKDPWAPNPAFSSRFPGAFYLPPTGEVPQQEPEPPEPTADDLDTSIEEEQEQLRQRLQDIEAILGAIDDDAFPTDRDAVDGLLDDLNTQLDSLGRLDGADLLDRLRNLVDRLDEWRDYLQVQVEADILSGDGLLSTDDLVNPPDDWQGDEEETEEGEEQPPDSYQVDEPKPEFEPDYARLDAHPLAVGDERD